MVSKNQPTIPDDVLLAFASEHIPQKMRAAVRGNEVDKHIVPVVISARNRTMEQAIEKLTTPGPTTQMIKRLRPQGEARNNIATPVEQPQKTGPMYPQSALKTETSINDDLGTDGER